SVAYGQLEEFAAFSGRTAFARRRGLPFGLDLQWSGQYYLYYSPLAAKGPISDEEWAERQERLAALRAESILSQALVNDSENESGLYVAYGPLESGCDTNGAIRMTNLIASLTESNGITVEFDIVGGGAQTNILWDVLS